ncbi:uncharacterized protein LOC135103173 [Scylla paramamosain]|uniref:uncharacterized protein LOC135103173 n=1 Tax=Scylla paramamosain TaxID=85552 RepID=UPI003083C16E
MCIGYTTLFVRLQLLQVRAIMTLTTLLVLYTLFSQVSAKLPDTAYIKMVDMWFFFCIFVIFAIIVVHLLTECLPQERPKPTAGSLPPPPTPAGFPAPPRKSFLAADVVKVRTVGDAVKDQRGRSVARCCVGESVGGVGGVGGWVGRWAWWRGVTAQDLLHYFRAFVIPVAVILFNAVYWLLLFT